jgi:small subunit ribosomal protein S6
MNEYELTVLLHPDLEMDLDAPLAKVDSIITDNGGKIIKQDNWGKKKLAYQIKKLDFAVYVHYELNLPASAPIKISNTLNITDEVIRYLLVKADPKAKEALEEAKAKKEAAKEEEA